MWFYLDYVIIIQIRFIECFFLWFLSDLRLVLLESELLLREKFIRVQNCLVRIKVLWSNYLIILPTYWLAFSLDARMEQPGIWRSCVSNEIEWTQYYVAPVSNSQSFHLTVSHHAFATPTVLTIVFGAQETTNNFSTMYTYGDRIGIEGEWRAHRRHYESVDWCSIFRPWSERYHLELNWRASCTLIFHIEAVFACDPDRI